MASIDEVVTGLQVLAKYAGKGGESQIRGAEHDVLFGPDAPHKVSMVDKRLLSEAGWHYDEEFQCWCRFV